MPSIHLKQTIRTRSLATLCGTLYHAASLRVSENAEEHVEERSPTNGLTGLLLACAVGALLPLVVLGLGFHSGAFHGAQGRVLFGMATSVCHNELAAFVDQWKRDVVLHVAVSLSSGPGIGRKRTASSLLAFSGVLSQIGMRWFDVIVVRKDGSVERIARKTLDGWLRSIKNFEGQELLIFCAVLVSPSCATDTAAFPKLLSSKVRFQRNCEARKKTVLRRGGVSGSQLKTQS